MNAGRTIQYMNAQRRAIETVIEHLDEIQVEFNAQFDEFKTSHDATLDKLAEQIVAQLDATSPELQNAIQEQLPVEVASIDERRQKLREEYLPLRQKAADDLLVKAQAEMAEMRVLNPELDEKEEKLKTLKAKLEGQLADLNEDIRAQSRGVGVVLHFVSITKADRKRHHILGRLEGLNDSIRQVRLRWEKERIKITERQEKYQNQWQLESIAVARLQSEQDQLDDDARREMLALQRATRQVLDDLKTPMSDPDPELNAGLERMIDLNIQTDGYHEGLASVGGFIGLLRGINSGLDAVRKSIEGLQNEQRMHSAYLKPLEFSLPSSVVAFHEQWTALGTQFADEEAIGASPIEFSANVRPILNGALSQARIEAMFDDLGKMIKQATAHW